jgi:uncharacterized protein (UPF0335 family)
MADLGHNSIASERLKSFVGRIETLEEEKKGIADDIRDVYAEAKGNGWDTKTMRRLIALRKLDPDARAEQQALLETYAKAIGLDLL